MDMKDGRLQASDLMIGDWVDVNGHKEIVEQIERYVLTTNDWAYDWKESVIKPIPLTPEILEKNGFVLEGYKYVLKYDHYVCVWVIFSTSDERHSVIHIDDDRERIPTTYHNTINYAHELQHALKLCKIEKTIEL